jgi:cell division protein ZapE
MPRLADRMPTVEARRLIGDLVPPPRFARESFDTYRPDPAEPTQAAAVAGLQSFVRQMAAPPSTSRFRFRRAAPPESRAGIYLDGGFGVGKTHLLAALWREAPGPKAFGTFVGYTHLVGALGFSRCAAALSGHRLVCIDEFELDDPGDTVLMASLLNRLVDAGVRLAATSNTLPGRLGQGRFAADDFLREIHGLAAHFDVYRIDGEDYRHRGLPEAPEPLADEAVRDASRSTDGGGPLDDFADLMAHLARVHPSRYGALLDGVERVHIVGVQQLDDQAAALRLVVMADRLYDRDIPVVASGVPLDRVFSEEMLRGGYRKKYYRAISRLVALAREGSGLAE